ncbi:hypothetical protein Tco_0340867 [Tanacetum coccineum]
MTKPQSPINEPSQANPHTTHSNHVSLQSHSLPLSDACNTNVGQASISSHNVNQSQTLFSHSLINPHVASVLHAQTLPSPQGDNHTQPLFPPSSSREMLMNDINQLQDLSNLLAMHLSQPPVIPILSDSPEESVGSYVPRVILFGTIPTSIPIIPMVPAKVPIAPADLLVTLEVGAVSVISPTRVLDLVDYSSSSDSDPSEDSLPVVPELPLVSPFLCSDDSGADSESEPAEQRPEMHESLAPSSKFPLAPVVAPLEIR